MSLIGALPYTFSNGTTADANQVDANFNYIVSQVNANVVTAIATAISAAVLVALPVGSIIDWSGSIASIPAPWQICDGTNGTPDLRDKFLVGAGDTYAVGATGGEATSTITVAGHTLSVAETPYHDHSFAQSPHDHGYNQTPHTHPGSTINDHSHTLSPGVWAQGVGHDFTGSSLVGSSPLTNTGGLNGGPFGATIAADTAQISFTAQDANITFAGVGGGGAHAHTASQDTNLPPYYALAKIMKMS